MNALGLVIKISNIHWEGKYSDIFEYSLTSQYIVQIDFVMRATAAAVHPIESPESNTIYRVDGHLVDYSLLTEIWLFPPLLPR